MKRTRFTMSNVPLLLVIFSLLLYSGSKLGMIPVSPSSGQGTAFAQEKGLSKVTFKVKCYDEGRAALRRLQGIQKVETGFHYLHEVNTVCYDPKMITIDEMETALKKAGTYVATITEKERN